MKRKPLTERVINVASFPHNRDTCDICGSAHATIGCPNGKQICQNCFDAGYDGERFYDDNDFHHF